jgi:hypothetical protein
MTAGGQHALAETSSQPGAWADALQASAPREAEFKRAWAPLNPESPACTRRGGLVGEGYLRSAALLNESSFSQG